jgi:hypothetical protein
MRAVVSTTSSAADAAYASQLERHSGHNRYLRINSIKLLALGFRENVLQRSASRQEDTSNGRAACEMIALVSSTVPVNGLSASAEFSMLAHCSRVRWLQGHYRQCSQHVVLARASVPYALPWVTGDETRGYKV